jgi:hypothetical protein
MRSHESPSLVHRLQLLRAVAALSPLSNWEPVGSLLEDARGALADIECSGLSRGEFSRLMLWATRWLALDMRLRRLYARESASRDVGEGSPVHAALWRVLTANPTVPSGALYGALRALWISHYGYPPPIELIPTLNEARTR